MVCGCFFERSIHAFTTLRIKILYLSTIFVSTTLHSRLAKHWSINGALTRDAGDCDRPNFLNLSMLRPDMLPHPTTCLISSTVGIFITHSFVFLRMSNV